jgi:putative oxidoreductase
MSDAAGLIVLAGRILFSVFFAGIAGVGHIQRSKMMEDYGRSAGFPLPAIAGWPSGLWLIAGGLSIGLGVWPDVGTLMIAAFVIPAAFWFHRFWSVEDQMQKMTQTQLFWRNMIALGASIAMFGMFVTLGEALRFTVTAPLFNF